MFTGPGTRVGRGESSGFFRKALNRMFGSHKLLANTGSGWDAKTLSAILDAEFGSTQGMLAYRGASGWSALSPSTSGYVLTTNGAGADPSFQAVGAVSSLWATAVDLDFSAQSSQTLSTDGTYTIGGLTWTKAQSANDATAMSVTNGSGLVIVPKQTTNYNGTTRTAPYLYLDITSVIPSFFLDMPIRIWMYVSADNLTANGDTVGMGLDNLSTSTNTLCTAVNERCVLAGPTKTFGVGATILNTSFTVGGPTTPLDNTDRVFVLSFWGGRWTAGLSGYSGAFSGGWPSQASLFPRSRTAPSTSNLNLPTQDIVTGLPMKFSLFAFRNGSATALSVTIQRVRIDFQVR